MIDHNTSCTGLGASDIAQNCGRGGLSLASSHHPPVMSDLSGEEFDQLLQVIADSRLTGYFAGQCRSFIRTPVINTLCQAPRCVC
jgi:hypothetical protein